MTLLVVKAFAGTEGGRAVGAAFRLLNYSCGRPGQGAHCSSYLHAADMLFVCLLTFHNERHVNQQTGFAGASAQPHGLALSQASTGQSWLGQGTAEGLQAGTGQSLESG